MLLNRGRGRCLHGWGEVNTQWTWGCGVAGGDGAGTRGQKLSRLEFLTTFHRKFCSVSFLLHPMTRPLHPPNPHSGTTQRLHGRKQVSIVFFSYLQFLEFLAPWSPSPWCHCGKRLRGRFRGCHWWAGRLDSNSSSSRPAFLGLGKDSSLSELQWLVDCVILETDKVKPFSVSFCLSVSVCVSWLRRLSTWRPCRGLAVWDAGSLFGLTPALCTVPLSHTFQYMPGFLQLRNLKLAITLEETEILGHQRPTGSSINGTSAFQRFKSNSLRKVPENKDYPLKHPKIAFTKKALWGKSILMLPFTIPNPSRSIKKCPFNFSLVSIHRHPPQEDPPLPGAFLIFSVMTVMGKLED